MSNGTQTIQRAKSEIRQVLRRYRLNWSDIAPDLDQENWRAIKPLAKKIRQELFRKSYPSLYARRSQKQKP